MCNYCYSKKAGYCSLLTFLLADGDNGAAELQTLIPIGINSPSSTLDPGASLEVDRVQCDHLGGCKEGVKVHLPHGTGDTVGAGRGADEPVVAGQGVVDVLADTNRARLVIVWVFCVASLEEEHKCG